LDNNQVKCWGSNLYGQLGLNDSKNRGDSPGEMGDALGAVDLGTGRSAKALATGYSHNCALLDNDHVKCWGYGQLGQLGNGDTQTRGDGHGLIGDALAAVDLGTGRYATSLSAGNWHTCALLDNGQVKCWGHIEYGALGIDFSGNNNIGNSPGEMGDALVAVNLGTERSANVVVAGGYHTCVLLDNSQVKCWGRNNNGQLGYGDTVNHGSGRGKNLADLGAVDLGTGRSAKALTLGDSHTCALLDNNQVKCWGANGRRQLGYGDTQNRGSIAGQMGDALAAVDFTASKADIPETAFALPSSRPVALLPLSVGVLLRAM